MVTQPRSGFTRIPYTARCIVRRELTTEVGVLCNISVLGVYVAVESGHDN